MDLDIHEDQLEIRYQDLDGDTCQVNPTSAVMDLLKTYRPEKQSDFMCSCVLRSFLLTFVILSCYVFLAMYVNRALFFLSHRNTCSSAFRKKKEFHGCLYLCLIDVYYGFISVILSSDSNHKFVDDILDIRKCSLMSLHDFILLSIFFMIGFLRCF